MADAGPFAAPLVEKLRPLYRLDWHGIHGWPHWVRVRENGLRLAEATGADIQVVELFALFHDIGRVNDNHDPDHGKRGAELVLRFVADLPVLDPTQIELLQYACAHHTDGLTDGDITVGTCWDADRLDLGRVGTRPRASRLCTNAAKSPAIIAWAWDRSRR